MKRSFSFPLLLRLIGICFINTISAYASPGDSIQPIPRINKEFLVVVHIVYDKDTTPVDRSEISAVISSVNTIFEPIGASFRICEYRDIYNFTYDTLTYKYDPEILVKYHVANRINLFMVSDFPDKPEACGYASLAGITSPRGRSIVIRKNCTSTIVVAHEMGHYFGLPHTFEGSGTELADGSNCQSAGDEICDTPSDPFVTGTPVSSYVDSECLFIYQGKDSKGNYYDPDVSNLMSYYTPCLCMKFTRGQYEKMVYHYRSNPVMW